MRRCRGERERDGDGGLGGGAVETPGSPNRSSSAAALLESCRARFGERERLRERRCFFPFFFSFFWRFSFFMAFFLRRRASSSLDETLDERERERRRRPRVELRPRALDRVLRHLERQHERPRRRLEALHECELRGLIHNLPDGLAIDGTERGALVRLRRAVGFGALDAHRAAGAVEVQLDAELALEGHCGFLGHDENQLYGARAAGTTRQSPESRAEASGP